MFWSVIGAAAFTIVYWVGGAWIIDRLTDQEPVRTAARTFLPWAALSPVVSVWGFLLDGVFIGATRTRELMQAMAVSLGVFLVASWLLVAPFANHGLWAALLVFMASRGLALSPLLPRIAAAIRVPAGGMQ